MKKLVITFGAALLLNTSAAHASMFTLDHYDVVLNAADSGLALWSQDILADGSTFTLDNVGQSVTRTLFQIGTKETQLNWDDLVPHTIDVQFWFTTPPPPYTDNANGITGAFTWGGDADPFGYVLWDNPLTLAFGKTGLLGITLQHGTFNLPGSAPVNATFTLLNADTGATPSSTSVPEPSTLLMLTAGLAVVGLWRRPTWIHSFSD